MRDENSGDEGGRWPGMRRLVPAAVLLTLAGSVLWATVRYSARDDAFPSEAPPRPVAVAADPLGTLLPVPASPAASASGSAAAPSALGPSASAPSALSSASPYSLRAQGTPSSRAATTPSKAGPAPATTKPAAAPAPTTRGPAVFRPVTVQAEAATLSGGAVAVDCATCDGGARVRYLGRVGVTVPVPVAGPRTVTVVYEADGVRSLAVTINGTRATVVTTSGSGWTVPRTVTFTVAFPAGTVNVGFEQGDGNGPDVDRISIN